MRPLSVLGYAAVLVASISPGCTNNTSTGSAAPMGACPDAFAQCTAFTDATAADADRTVSFGGSVGSSYGPKCVRAKAGQSVTFSGNFSMHPIAQACGPLADMITRTASPQAFDTAGRYGYFCSIHGTQSGIGMAGAIDVVP